MMLPAVTLGLLIGPPPAPEKAPRDLLAAIQSLEITQGDGGRPGAYQQGFRMTLDAERGRAARPDYFLLLNGLLDTGRRVVFTVTVRGTARVLFDGVITRRELAGGDKPVITVLGNDLTIYMEMAQEPRSYSAQDDKAIALAIIGNYQKYGITPRADTPATSSPATKEQRAKIQWNSDLAYLRALAARNGFIFYLKPGPGEMKSEACWVKKPFAAPEQKALSTNLGAGTNVDSISFSYDALAPHQIVGDYADPDTGEPTPIQALGYEGDKSLSKKGALTSDGTFVRKLRLQDSPFSAAEALARAQAEANRSAERAMKVTGTLTTARYGDVLIAPGIVSVRGAGATHDGQYYVDKVTHKLSLDSYTQEFSLSREGTGSTIQNVRRPR